MRKVLFRGRKKEFHHRDKYGEWIYGDLMQGEICTSIYSKGKFLGAVFPETVEQYIGKDENGNRIFKKVEELYHE